MLRTAAALALLVVLIGVTGARQTYAGGAFLVDTTSDAVIVSGCNDNVADGDCSLRGAIILTNSTPGNLDAIIFGLGPGVPEIDPQSPLPDITAPVLIDGASGGSDAILIAGISASGTPDGLRLVDHTGSTIKHMVIHGFGGAGIVITGGGSHTIIGNKIGTTNDGTGRFSNQNGVSLQDTTGNTIGSATAGNVISGNLDSGVLLDTGANNNTVAGNIIGLSQDQSIVIDNEEGVSIFGSGNQIGTPGLANVISGNVGDGIDILGADNRVQSNLIGTNALHQAKPNQHNGIYVCCTNGGAKNIIGGSLEDGNTISGNAMSGVHIESPATVEVSGNIIGLDRFSDFALPNQGDGVEVVQHVGFTTAGVTGIEIGKLGVPNTISGNIGDGIVISGVNGVSVRGNNIGVNLDKTAGFGNGRYGINVAAAGDNTIGDNFVAASPGDGIFIDGRDGDAAGNDILNNFVGGIPDVGGNDVGIRVVADSTNIMNNTIVQNVVEGIILAGDDNVVGGNFIGTNSEGDDVGNGGDGVAISGNRNMISRVSTLAAQPAGGPLFPPGTNIIWNNVGSGVFVADGVGNTINQNSMKDNVDGGIDLAPEGPTPNDTDDPDQGANTLQNYPVLTAAGNSQTFTQGIHPSGGGGILQGSLNSTPNTEFLIDVYTQGICNEITNLQPAEEWIGSFEVTTNGNGDVQFSQVAFTDMQSGAFINATATNPTGSTSELSDCIQATANVSTPTPSPTQTSGPSLTPTPTPGPTDVPGDADCSGVVDIDDFIAALSEVAGVPPGAPCPGNVGCEDPIDAQDALDILKYVASPADYPLPLC